jgi:hypothetical protein
MGCREEEDHREGVGNGSSKWEYPPSGKSMTTTTFKDDI